MREASVQRARIAARRLTIERGGRTLIRAFDLSLDERSRVAIVGENGRGKSTLLSALAGGASALPGCTTSGVVDAAGPIGFADQELPATEADTVGSVADRAILPSLAALAELDEAAEALASASLDAGSPERVRRANAAAEQRYSAALDAATALDAWEARTRVDRSLEALDAETDRSRPISALSVGQRYRVRLATLLGGDDGILLLDEPTNHLDAAGLDHLAEALLTRRGGFALVSHDRRLLADVAETFWDLDPTVDGRPLRSGGGFSGHLEAKAAERSRWEQAAARQQRLADRLEDDLEAARDRLESGWRPPKGTGKHQRATRADGVVQSVRRREAELDRVRVDAPVAPVRFAIPEAREPFGFAETPPREPPTGDLLVADDVSVDGRMGDRVSLRVSAGSRLLVTGTNGAGKSTLLSVLSGALVPDSGRVIMLPRVRVGVLGQETDDGNEAEAGCGTGSSEDAYRERAGRLVSRGLLGTDEVVPLEAFGLLGERERALPIEELSVGQRRRFALALVLLGRPDVLILDEPTNHLSISLVDELTVVLRSLPCAVVVATHDRGLLSDLRDWPRIALGGARRGIGSDRTRVIRTPGRTEEPA